MTQNRALSIKNWIKSRGFKLTRSHLLNHRTKTIKYYTLGNFGVYEEITPSKSAAQKKRKFISWTPWGENFEVTSVSDLSKAFEEFENYNPDIALN